MRLLPILGLTMLLMAMSMLTIEVNDTGQVTYESGCFIAKPIAHRAQPYRGEKVFAIPVRTSLRKASKTCKVNSVNEKVGGFYRSLIVKLS